MNKLLSIGFIGLCAVTLVGCGSNEKDSSTEVVSEIAKKDLTHKDVDSIEIGISVDKLLEQLGKPAKIWKADDFIYSQLDGAVIRDDLVSTLSKGELGDKHKKLKEIGNKTKEIDGLQLYQFEYLSSSDTKGTFLVWVNPESDIVVYVNERSYIDTSGEAEKNSDTSESTSSEKEETSTSNKGSRSNPLELNDSMFLTGTFTDYDADRQKFDAQLEVTVLSTIRGEEAWNIIVAENQFNTPPPEGKEYIINSVSIKMSEATSDDLKTSFSYSDFDYISKSGASYDRKSVVLPNSLKVELYNNGEAEGNISGLADIGDEPLIRLSNKFFFKTN